MFEGTKVEITKLENSCYIVTTATTSGPRTYCAGSFNLLIDHLRKSFDEKRQITLEDFTKGPTNFALEQANRAVEMFKQMDASVALLMERLQPLEEDMKRRQQRNARGKPAKAVSTKSTGRKK